MKKIVIEKHKNGINILFFPSSKREDFEIDEIRDRLAELGLYFDGESLQDEKSRTIYNQWNLDWSVHSDKFPVFIVDSLDENEPSYDDDEIDDMIKNLEIKKIKRSALKKQMNHLRYRLWHCLEKIKLAINEGKYDENEKEENGVFK